MVVCRLNENNDCVGVAYRKRVDRGSENIGYVIQSMAVRQSSHAPESLENVHPADLDLVGVSYRW